MTEFDLIVIGQGYAGLRAAQLARKHGLSVATFEGVMAGGAVMTVLHLDPSPESRTQSGPDLGALLGMENLDLGVRTFFDAVTALRPRASGGWNVETINGVFGAQHVMLATGSKPRLLDVPGEAEFTGNGVSNCADCDGPRVVAKDCVVVGGGDAAFQEAAILARFAASVTILIRSTPSARPARIDQALASDRVTLVNIRRVIEIHGDATMGVTGIDIEMPENRPSHIPCSGVFVFIGQQPQTALLPQDTARDTQGALLTDEHGALALPGLWAIGAVRSGFGGLLTNAGEDAERALAALLASRNQHSVRARAVDA